MPAAFDVVIVGGGPAGLSAALLLGRCRRRVALCDEGRSRSSASNASHGFFTRDGERPADMLRIGRAQLAQYDVEFFDTRALAARAEPERFVVTLASQREIAGRRLLLATGIDDELPHVAGIEALYGTSVFPCPYCDAWEVRDQPLAVYGRGAHVATFALGITVWSRDVVLCTDGDDHGIDDETAQRLVRHGVRIYTQRIARLDGANGRLEAIVFANQERLPRRALFFDMRTVPSSDLAASLGCELAEQCMVKTDPSGRTSVPGVYVAGDVSCDLNFVAVAVAEGLKAGCAIHQELRKQDLV
jgi:thioredoxin reductase